MDVLRQQPMQPFKIKTSESVGTLNSLQSSRSYALQDISSPPALISKKGKENGWAACSFLVKSRTPQFQECYSRSTTGGCANSDNGKSSNLNRALRMDEQDGHLYEQSPEHNRRNPLQHQLKSSRTGFAAQVAKLMTRVHQIEMQNNFLFEEYHIKQANNGKLRQEVDLIWREVRALQSKDAQMADESREIESLLKDVLLQNQLHRKRSTECRE